MAEELKPHHYWREDRITGRLVVITPDEYEQWGKDNQPSEAYRPAFTRAQLPSQGSEAVEVVASIAVDAEGAVHDFTLEPGLDRHPGGYTVTPLMTVAQHQRILATATHPADQVAEGVVVPIKLLKIIEQSWRIPNGCPKSVSEEVGEIIGNGLAELRALLASKDEVRP